jgi:homoserine O-acetyltransferase
VQKEFFIADYMTTQGVFYSRIPVSYQIVGVRLGDAPVVLINHALTGNSNVLDWWGGLVGAKKLIDTQKYTIIAFDLVGNGQNGFLIDNYRAFILEDMAIIILKILAALAIEKLHAIIGGSLGGGLAWEIAVRQPNLAKYIIPIAAHWQASDWVIGHNYIQECLLRNSTQPLEDARKMAMLFYRTPVSLQQKFGRTTVSDTREYNVNSWLEHHGTKLAQRFNKKAYLMMNHLLSTIDINKQKNIEKVLKSLKSTIIQIAIDTDLFFVKEDMKFTHELLQKLGQKTAYYEVTSVHGHDAFLIEYKQLTTFLKPYFK